MNYSMEERGQLSQPSLSTSPTKYLNSNISYFGVRGAGSGDRAPMRRDHDHFSLGAAVVMTRIPDLLVSFPCLHQVGSKNAAFFIGSSVKVVTRRVGEPYVHELQLSAGELEQRYRLGQVRGCVPDLAVFGACRMPGCGRRGESVMERPAAGVCRPQVAQTQSSTARNCPPGQSAIPHPIPHPRSRPSTRR